MTKIFVYGSLQRGKSAYDIMERHNSKFIRKAVTDPKYHIYRIDWYPGMVVDKNISGGVHGEVHEVTDECIEDLDYYEDDPNMFKKHDIILENGDKVIAYLYMQSITGKKRTESGVWNG